MNTYSQNYYVCKGSEQLGYFTYRISVRVSRIYERLKVRSNTVIVVEKRKY